MGVVGFGHFCFGLGGGGFWWRKEGKGRESMLLFFWRVSTVSEES